MASGDGLYTLKASLSVVHCFKSRAASLLLLVDLTTTPPTGRQGSSESRGRKDSQVAAASGLPSLGG